MTIARMSAVLLVLAGAVPGVAAAQPCPPLPGDAPPEVKAVYDRPVESAPALGNAVCAVNIHLRSGPDFSMLIVPVGPKVYTFGTDGKNQVADLVQGGGGIHWVYPDSPYFTWNLGPSDAGLKLTYLVDMHDGFVSGAAAAVTAAH